MKEYAIFTAERVLIGIEKGDFNVIQLAEKYGAGTFEVDLFENGRMKETYRQTISEKCVPKRDHPPISPDFLPKLA